MKQILVQLRAMQLFAHSAHNLVARVPFHQDHEFFGEVYQALDDDYDSVAERMIGFELEAQLELNSLLMDIMNTLKGCPSIGVSENSVFYKHQLAYENKLCQLISEVIKSGVTPGCEQLLGEICNKSEMRKYKIKQRIKGSASQV